LNRTKFARFGAIILLIAACDSLRTQHLQTAEILVGDSHIRAEIAATPDERERGLMYRTSLGENEGMLFVFPQTSMQAFWMKNTLIPLDVGFFDDQGFLIEALTMSVDKPDVDPEKRPTYNSSEPALYALEMPAGWFKKKEIRKYARLVLPRPIRGL